MRYEEARSLIQTGDVLLAVGGEKDIVAMGIRAVTNSPYTHAGIARVDYGRVIAYEATASGTTDNALSRWKERGYISVSVFRADSLDVAAMMEYLLDNKGKAYDYAQIGKIWAHELFPHVKGAESGDKFICSEYVSGAMEAGGVDPCLYKVGSYTTPADLSRSPRLTYVLDFTI